MVALWKPQGMLLQVSTAERVLALCRSLEPIRLPKSVSILFTSSFLFELQGSLETNNIVFSTKLPQCVYRKRFHLKVPWVAQTVSGQVHREIPNESTAGHKYIRSKYDRS